MIREFHIHLYFNANTIEVAKSLVQKMRKNKVPMVLGHFNEREVGPHTRWSVQILTTKEDFGEVLSFIALNREGLTVFSHPVTGDDLRDHTDYAIWMGEIVELDLEGLK